MCCRRRAEAGRGRAAHELRPASALCCQLEHGVALDECVAHIQIVQNRLWLLNTAFSPFIHMNSLFFPFLLGAPWGLNSSAAPTLWHSPKCGIPLPVTRQMCRDTESKPQMTCCMSVGGCLRTDKPSWRPYASGGLPHHPPLFLRACMRCSYCHYRISRRRNCFFGPHPSETRRHRLCSIGSVWLLAQPGQTSPHRCIPAAPALFNSQLDAPAMLRRSSGHTRPAGKRGALLRGLLLLLAGEWVGSRKQQAPPATHC